MPRNLDNTEIWTIPERAFTSLLSGRLRVSLQMAPGAKRYPALTSRQNGCNNLLQSIDN